ncbi:MAG TPA: cytochrome c [Steroidobacteraceae bacterium]|jgi:mono/diheme cytochrome c family protein
MKTRLLILMGLSFSGGGCERGMHQMYEQPKYLPLAPSTLFSDGNSSRPQLPGTVPRVSSGASEVAQVAASPIVTAGLLARGRERFDIYCAPCHGRAGHGDGVVARRGFPAPPSFHTEALRAAPDSVFYQTITEGYGVMYPYADRIAPADRWAIIAYIRALQLSQHAPAALLNADDTARLQAAEP